jgi:aromatic ring-opening dioxygenase catalytic subunit (LigB family)
MTQQKLPTLFLSHGGGPWHVIPQMQLEFAQTERFLKQLASTLTTASSAMLPKAILMISAHWETPQFTVSSAQLPAMIYDYSGFPDYTYKLQYAAQGSPQLAQTIKSLLANANITCVEDPQRGFDHGAFVPLMLMYPTAEIPVVTLSIKASYDAAEHIQLGQALAPLREQGVLIVGSGYTYHNMRGYGRPESMAASVAFEAYLTTAIESASQTRNALLTAWQNAPYARQNHPIEDHLVPLFVVAGAAGNDVG